MDFKQPIKQPLRMALAQPLIANKTPPSPPDPTEQEFIAVEDGFIVQTEDGFGVLLESNNGE